MTSHAGTPFYVTTPIYYVNDAPHIGHAYTTVAADVLARWRRLWGDDVVFLTGTDEHGLKIQRAAEAHDVTPREWADRNSALLPRRVGRPRHHQRRLHPHDRAPPPPGGARSSSSGSTTPATSSSTATRASTASAASSTTRRTSSTTACAARSTARVVEHVTEENYFFRLSRYEDRLLAHYTEHPEAVQPAGKRNEVLGLIKQGLHDFSISRTSISWGIPLPWDDRHVAYVWFDALINYCTAVGYPDDRDRFDRYWPAELPPHRQGHPPPARGVLARDADGRGRGAAEDACSRTATCSWAARR